MRITLVIGGLSGGGAERVCVNLANSWVERGHQVTLLTFTQNFRKPAYAIDSRVQQRDLGWPRRARQEELTSATVGPIMRGLSQAPLLQQLVQHITFFALLRHKILVQAPDVVVAHIDMTNIRVLAAMHESNIPVIVCEHSDSTRVSIGSWIGVRAALYRRAKAVVTPHPESAEWLSKYDFNVVRIANPLVAPSPTPVERNGERRRLVALMRLSHEKRPEMVVRAFASIAAEFPNWYFDIYGTGALHDWITNLIEKLPRDEFTFVVSLAILMAYYGTLISMCQRRGSKVLETRSGKRLRVVFRWWRWRLVAPFVRSCVTVSMV